MKKTIWKLSCALLALFSTSAVCAQITKPSDLFGTYEFTADLELTEAGQPYADRFSTKCDVTIEKHWNRDMIITGIAGASFGQGGNLVNGNIDVFDFNGYGESYLWGEPLVYANENGESPYRGVQWDLFYTVDPATKNITIPDFTAITVDATWQVGTILAKFTNCKLTFKKGTAVEREDMSGNYHFVGEGTMEGSSIPTEFDITLTAKDETHQSYQAALNFGEGFKTVTLDATYDGTELAIGFKDTYLDEAQTLLFADFNTLGSEGSIKFNQQGTNKVFSLSNGICIKNTEGALQQYYMNGEMSETSTVNVDFTGTYHVKSDYLFNIIAMGGEDPFNYEYPTEFDITVKQNEADGRYYISEFLSLDITQTNWTGTFCTVEGNKLQIPTGLAIDRLGGSEDGLTQYYHALFNAEGKNEGSVDLTLNEDGTCSMTDFFLMRKTIVYNSETWQEESVEYANAAFYSELSVTRKGLSDAINETKAGADAPRISVSGGIIRVAGEPTAVRVYNTAGALVFSGVTSAVSGLNKGVYIVKAGAASVKVAL